MCWNEKDKKFINFWFAQKLHLVDSYVEGHAFLPHMTLETGARYWNEAKEYFTLNICDINFESLFREEVAESFYDELAEMLADKAWELAYKQYEENKE